MVSIMQVQLHTDNCGIQCLVKMIQIRREDLHHFSLSDSRTDLFRELNESLFKLFNTFALINDIFHTALQKLLVPPFYHLPFLQKFP